MVLQPSNHPKPQRCSIDNLEKVAERETGKEEKKEAEKAEKEAEKDADKGEDKAEKAAEKDVEKEVFHLPLLPVHLSFTKVFPDAVFYAFHQGLPFRL